MPYFSYPQIQIGPLSFYTWGTLLALAFLIGYYLILREAKKQSIKEIKIFWLTLFVICGGIFGSRLAYAMQFPSYYFYHPWEIFQFWSGGLMIYGGFFGALAAGTFYIKKAHLNFSQIANIIAPSLALGIFIARIGCSLINDHQGAITSLPWAIEWPDGSLRHPVAEYLSLNGLLLFLILKYGGDKINRLGKFRLFIWWYPLSRFLLDFTRSTNTQLSDPHYYGLTISQWISLLVLLILAVFYLVKSRKNNFLF